MLLGVGVFKCLFAWQMTYIRAATMAEGTLEVENYVIARDIVCSNRLVP